LRKPERQGQASKTMPSLVPPIKCQGIKTKLIPTIKLAIPQSLEGRWIEPFCGSGVVAFNIKPTRALLTDTNTHIINLYRSIQNGSITPSVVIQHLQAEGERLLQEGERYYYEVRSRFNESHQPLDFLFLNRSCFNGVMRFNKRGKFNVPFCRKPQRFAQAYITKIANQVRAVTEVLYGRQWDFEVADFKLALSEVQEKDVVYADPPYLGRHVDYFNSWSESDEQSLLILLKQLPCAFILSTWQHNKYRLNSAIQEHWQEEGYNIISVEHFYHVGASEDLRHSMVEALITNYRPNIPNIKQKTPEQLTLAV
jgi:DNA adenine methylase